MGIKDNEIELKTELEVEEVIAKSEDEEGLFSDESEVPIKFAVSDDDIEVSDDNEQYLESPEDFYSDESDFPVRFAISDEDDCASDELDSSSECTLEEIPWENEDN